MEKEMKKGEVSVFPWTIIGVVIAVILVVATWRYGAGLFAPLIDDPTANVHSEQQFAVFVEKLQEMKDGERFSKLYGVGNDYVVVGFLKGKNVLGGETCSFPNREKITLSEEIVKPRTCGDKACLCLCRGGLRGCGEQENSFCQPLDFDVRDDQSSCGYLIIEERVGNVYVRREQNVVYVNLEKGGKGSA